MFLQYAGIFMENSSGETETKKFPVVGIGASAGGVEAVTELFRHIPSDTGAAFVYVQHLAPKQESMLTEIIRRSTNMPVQTAQDNVRVEPNNVYVIPPATTITIKNGVLELESKSAMYHYPIDRFFISLAQEYKAKAIGIVLSGTGTDGTEGLRAIYAEGGLTIVQKTESAKYQGMPSSALSEGVVHFALSLEEIGKNLVSMINHPYLRQDLEAAGIKEETGYKVVTNLLKLKFGVDFSKYKENTINRRISRRMLIHKMENLPDYVALLQKDPKELRALYDDFLIGVTHFFREPEAFKLLSEQILPRLIKQKPPEESIRVWVPGCATGEEAYSVGICIREYLEKDSKALTFQVFGTDLNEKYVERARAGIYSENISQHVSEARLTQFFHKINGEYQVNKLIRDGCIFSQHDLTKDPPFSNMDLIFCRNLLIYLKPDTQERVLRLFHYGLRNNGFLILGHSENVGKTEALFNRTEDSVYSKRPVATNIITGFEVFNVHPTDQARDKRKPPYVKLQKTMTDLMMERFGLSSVLINGTGQVLVFQSDLSPYMQISPGEASLSLLSMIKDELRAPVQTALIRAKKERKPVKQEDILIFEQGQREKVDVEVIPVEGEQSEILYAVLFEKKKEETEGKTERQQRLIQRDIEKKTPQSRDQLLETLQNELQSTKETLRSVVEDHEATNEELRAALEEVQSGNEELQSTNEELETAKEELQSVNEELNTVNRELTDRNDTLNRVNDDLNNLFNNINIAVIALDGSLRIRMFTPLAGERFNILPTDVGRSISDINLKIDVPDIEKMALETIQSLSSKEMKVKDDEGHSYLMRVRPYVTTDKKITGAVFSFIDIDPAEYARTENSQKK